MSHLRWVTGPLFSWRLKPTYHLFLKRQALSRPSHLPTRLLLLGSSSWPRPLEGASGALSASSKVRMSGTSSSKLTAIFSQPAVLRIQQPGL